MRKFGRRRTCGVKYDIADDTRCVGVLVVGTEQTPFCTSPFMSATYAKPRAAAASAMARLKPGQSWRGTRPIGTGPSLPCSGPSMSRSFSSLRKYGSTSFQPQPRAPICAHSS